MPTLRLFVLVLIFKTGLEAQVRTYCQPDGSLIAASQGYAPREAARRLREYDNESAPDANVFRALQSGLTFLGYKPGEIDGRYHDSIVTALVSFQEDFGIPDSGVLDSATLTALINELKDAQEFLTESDCVIPLSRKSGIKVRLDETQCNHGFVRKLGKCVPVGVPTNASVSVAGHDWVCKFGYVHQDNSCTPVVVPDNETLNLEGNGWACRRGFLKQGDRCEMIRVPENAGLNLSGDGWICRRGFVAEGERCAPIVLPANATLNLNGTDWVCRQGYYRRGNECIKP
jgi:hypothetical protein